VPYEVVVRDNPSELRYEALVDGRMVGLIRYRQEPGVVVLAHSEVDLDREGTGVGSELVRGALADIRARGLGMVPHCPFVIDYLRRHPEDLDRVSRDPAVPE
jgi:predicted GNAT family acetyltransferase